MQILQFQKVAFFSDKPMLQLKLVSGKTNQLIMEVQKQGANVDVDALEKAFESVCIAFDGDSDEQAVAATSPQKLPMRSPQDPETAYKEPEDAPIVLEFNREALQGNENQNHHPISQQQAQIERAASMKLVELRAFDSGSNSNKNGDISNHGELRANREGSSVVTAKSKKSLLSGGDPNEKANASFKRMVELFKNDVDALHNGVFVIKGKRYLYAKRSLNCITSQSRLRQVLVRLSTSPIFDGFITGCIVVNSLLMASKSYRSVYDEGYESSWNEVLEITDLFFTGIFLLECLVKVIAMGFVRHRNAYLKDAWNCMDFFIVLVSLANFAPGASSESLKSLRTMRVMRPLRSIGALKMMKVLIQTMFASIPGLFNVCVFLVFMFSIFAIFGVHTFMGQQYNFCRATPELIDDGIDPPYWPIHEEARWLCKDDGMCSGYPNYLGNQTVAKCGNIYLEYGLDPIQYDKTRTMSLIQYDTSNFNDVVSAGMMIFQVITLEGWAEHLYNYQDAASFTASSVYFAAVVLIGSFISLNLVIAQIMQSFIDADEARIAKTNQEQNEREEEKMYAHQSDDPVKLHLLQDQSQGPMGQSIVSQLGLDAKKKSGLVPLPERDFDSEQDSSLYSSESAAGEIKKEDSFEIELQESEGEPEAAQEKSQLSKECEGDAAKPKDKDVVFFSPRQLIQSERKRLEKDEGLVRAQTDKKKARRQAKPTNRMSKSRSLTLTREQAQGQSQEQASAIEPDYLKLDSIKTQKQTTMGSTALNPAHSASARFTLSKIPERKLESDESESISYDPHCKIGLKKASDISVTNMADYVVGGPKFAGKRLSETLSLKARLAQDGSSEGQTGNTMPHNKLPDSELTPVEARANQNKLFYVFYHLVANHWFNFTIYVLIFLNTVTLALYRYNQSDLTFEVLEACDIFFTCSFLLEMICKLIGLGFKAYAADSFNLFDGAIVLISLADMTLFLVLNDTDSALMRAFRALRLLRVLKLARIWKAFQEILKRIQQSLIDVSNFSLLLMIFLFIFALLGMEFFANILFYDIDGNPVMGETNIQAAYAAGVPLFAPRQNFNNIFYAMVSIFIVVIGEDWHVIANSYVRASEADEGDSGRKVAIAYFLLLVILGHVMMLALFTALLLRNFESNLEKTEQKLRQQIKQKAIRRMSKAALDRQLSHVSSGSTGELSICTKANVRKCCARFQLQFKLIFSGDKAAFIRKSKTLLKKQPNHSASPISGDAKKTREQDDKVDLKDIFGSSSDEADQERSKGLQKLLMADVNEFKDHGLQRPLSLMHYDYLTNEQVDDRAKSKSKLAHLPDEIDLRGRSLWLFDKENPIRVKMAVLVNHKLFETLIIFCIVLSTLTLAFEDPLGDPKGSMKITLYRLDYFFTVVFTVEAAIKIVAIGFILQRKTYLRSVWNILDFTIVVSAWISILFDSDIQFIKALRILRIMRPLRLVTRVQGLRIAIISLVKAMPSIAQLQVVVIFFMYTFAILMTTLLSGKLHSCKLEHTMLSNLQAHELVRDKWSCLNYGGEWENTEANFDHTLNSMRSLFVLFSGEHLILSLQWTVDAVGVDQQPRQDENHFFTILHVVIVLMFSLLFFNMFVGVVIETFNREKEHMSYNHLLSKQQRSWIQIQTMTYKAKPIQQVQEGSGSWIRDLCIRIAFKRWFENFILISIILNTVVLALRWFNQSQLMLDYLSFANFTFNIVFTIEAVIKIVALKGNYFREAWNIFDFSIVTLTYTFLLLQTFDVLTGVGSTTTILRSLRIGRVLRLIKKAQKLSIIFYTIVDSLASLGSLGLLLLLFVYMFAIIGTQNFGMVKIGAPQIELNEHANFQTFWNAFFILLRCATGEGWDGIMYDAARTFSARFPCRANETYESIMANGGEPFACGSPQASYIFFVAFQVICKQIFLNLFVAIIIDAFLGHAEMFQLPIQQYEVNEFSSLWSKYDPEATGFICLDDLTPFLWDVARNSEAQNLIVLREFTFKDEATAARFIGHLHIPTYDQFRKVMFYDVLQQLCHKKNLLVFNEDKIQKVHRQQKVLQALGAAMRVKSPIQLVMGAKKDKIESNFDRTIIDLASLDKKIQLLKSLQSSSLRVHKSFGCLADTTSNIHLTHEERLAMPRDELIKLNRMDVQDREDVFLYTTMHAYCVQTIKQRWLTKIKTPSQVPQAEAQVKVSHSCPEESKQDREVSGAERDQTLMKLIEEAEQEVSAVKPSADLMQEAMQQSRGRDTPRSRLKDQPSSKLSGAEMIDEELKRMETIPLHKLRATLDEAVREDAA